VGVAGSGLSKEVKAVGSLFILHEEGVDLIKELAEGMQGRTQGSVGVLILNPLIVYEADRDSLHIFFLLSYMPGYAFGVYRKKDGGEGALLVDTRSFCNKVYGMDVGLIIGGGQVDPIGVWRRAADGIICLSAEMCGGRLIHLTARIEGLIHVDLRYEKYLRSEVLEELVSYGRMMGASRRFKMVTRGANITLTVEAGVSVEYAFTVLRLGCAKLVKCGFVELINVLRRSVQERRREPGYTGRQVVARLKKALGKLKGEYGDKTYVVAIIAASRRDEKKIEIHRAVVQLDLSVEELEKGAKDVKDEEAKRALEILVNGARSLLGEAEQKNAKMWNILEKALEKTVELVYGSERDLEVLVELPAEKVERECEAEQPKPGASGGGPS